MTTPTNDAVETYKDDAGEWRWRRRSANNRVLSVSSEGYKNHDDCVEMARRCNSDVYID